LNFPFREPLIPKLDENLFTVSERPSGYVKVLNGELLIGQDHFREIAGDLKQYKKGIIICGQIEDERFAAAITRLAAALNFPILADPLSQLRSGEHSGESIIEAYDTFLRNDEAKAFLKPDVVIRFGAMPVSKALTIFLKENHQAVQYVVDGGGGWRDPAALSTHMVYCNEARFCEELVHYVEGSADTAYLKNWEPFPKQIIRYQSI
jgi:2-succinyl-5-enolpyruvyl-6-hydroxy-3-cyclohexene-1-carboxylate synthase